MAARSIVSEKAGRLTCGASTDRSETVPNYILLLHDTGTMPEGMSPAEIQAVIQRYVAWRQRVQAGGRRVEGHKLRDGSGRTVRGATGAPTVTDGPYAESREVIGGLFLIEAA